MGYDDMGFRINFIDKQTTIRIQLIKWIEILERDQWMDTTRPQEYLSFRILVSWGLSAYRIRAHTEMCSKMVIIL